MLQVTLNSIREVIYKDGDYVYKSTGEPVEEQYRLGHHAYVFRHSSEGTGEPDVEALDAIEANIEKLRQDALRKAGKLS